MIFNEFGNICTLGRSKCHDNHFKNYYKLKIFKKSFKLVDAPKSLHKEQPMFLPLGPSDVKMVCAISSIAAGPKMETIEWILCELYTIITS